MAEAIFERELDRMYAEAPAFPDAALFALEVDRRLDRGWTMRQAVIGSFGIVGGVIGGAQILGAGLASRLGDVSVHVGQVLERTFTKALPTGWSTADLPLGGEALWLSAALAIVAVGLAITRAIREV